MKKLNEFKIVKGVDKQITATEAKAIDYYYIEHKIKTFLGKEKWVTFKAHDDKGFETIPEFKTKVQAEKYLKDLKKVLSLSSHNSK